MVKDLSFPGRSWELSQISPFNSKPDKRNLSLFPIRPLSEIMENGLKTGSPTRDVQSSANGKPPFEDLISWDTVPSTSPPGVWDHSSDERNATTTPKETKRWTVLQTVLGERDAALGFKGRGWKTAPFIFLGEFGERVASFGLQFNIINYFVIDLNFPLAKAASTATIFFGASGIAPLGGAFIADAYLGRFLTLAIGCIIYLLGFQVFTISALNKSLHPESCKSRLSGHPGKCQEPNKLQLAVLYISLALQCLGSAGIRPCPGPFGADQFDKSNKKHESQLRHYFNWYYMSFGVAFLVSLTLIVYLQDSFGFGWGGIVCVILMGAATAVFLAGTPYYIYVPPAGSPLTKLVQVVVAAVRKRNAIVPKNPDNLYDAGQFHDRERVRVGTEVLHHTENLRFFDKAAIVDESEPDPRKKYHPWRLATVHRVEELKIVLRMVPVWLCGILVSLVTVQNVTFGNLQALSMDRHIGKLNVPPASMLAFSMLALVLFIPLYDLVIVKLLRKFTKDPKGLSYLQRIGVGTFLTIFTMVSAALVEKKRRSVARESGLADKPMGLVVLPISAFWLVPQFVLSGFSESFVAIGQLEFFYDEAPESLRSMSNAFFSFGLGIGSLLSSLFVDVIQEITATRGRKGWLQNNINLGHLDYYYWVLAVLSAINFVLFLFISSWYVYKNRNVAPSPLDAEVAIQPTKENDVAGEHFPTPAH